MQSKILDTQIISYAAKGRFEAEIHGRWITSTTANEFLLVQGTAPNKANYYVPLPNRLNHPAHTEEAFSPRRDHPFSKFSTDQLIIDFGNEYPVFVEHGNFAITEVINTQHKLLFNQSIRFLTKEKVKLLRRRFDFILSQDIKCMPVTREVVQSALNLFNLFTSKHNPKNNIRNTVNDVLILATAMANSRILVTKDNLLSRFAAEYYEADVQSQGEVVKLAFDEIDVANKKKNSESKGYINRGWQYHIRSHTGVS